MACPLCGALGCRGEEDHAGMCVYEDLLSRLCHRVGKKKLYLVHAMREWRTQAWKEDMKYWWQRPSPRIQWEQAISSWGAVSTELLASVLVECGIRIIDYGKDVYIEGKDCFSTAEVRFMVELPWLPGHIVNLCFVNQVLMREWEKHPTPFPMYVELYPPTLTL